MIDWIVNLLRDHPELAIFLTLGLGFWIGKIKIGTFSLGAVTSVLLIGVLVGQLDIPVGGPLKQVAFLFFLFAIGYKVGPQFFRGLKRDGLPQVYFAIVMCVFILLVTWGISLLMGYNAGEAAGLLSGAQTISAVIGVAGDTIQGLSITAAEKQNYVNVIPVAYALTYIFGTAGSAWVLASIGPRMLGGLDKVKAACRELEGQMGSTQADEPGFIHAKRPVVFRAYRIANPWFKEGKTVQELEEFFLHNGRRLFVERLRKEGKIINDIVPTQPLAQGDEVVLSGRREFAIGEENWIGKEVEDEALLDFPVMVLPVMVVDHGKKGHPCYAEKTVKELRSEPFMHGVSIRRIKRMDVNVPVFQATVIDGGDMLELVGQKQDVESAAHAIGDADPASHATDMVFVSLGIVIGGILGSLALHLGGVPISLSSSGGALIAGLVFGWWRSRRPVRGNMPDAAQWIFNNVGLNLFIAVVGIKAGPSFVEGFKSVGVMLFVVGAIATTLPLLFGVYIAKHWFHFHPAIALGCVAGARTTTAAFGAVQEAVGSETPALGYTVTYAVGNTLLIIWGVVIVLLM